MRVRAVVASMFAVGLFAAAHAQQSHVPVVLMHGLLSNAADLQQLQQWLEADFPGIYVKNVEIGDGKFDSIFMNMNDQVANFAQQLQSDPLLADGAILIGHSQGGLITRAYMERYNSHPTVHHFISLAGPQGGVYGVPDFNDWCPDADCPWLAALMSKIIEKGWFEAIAQNFITFAQYWRDPLNYNLYLNSSGFLADVNNERATKNDAYRFNMISTTGQVHLVEAEDDHIVVPKQSAHFEFFAVGQDTTILNLTQTPGYINDWIGLRTLDSQGRLYLHRVPCTHRELPHVQCKSTVYDAIIKPLITTP